MSRIGRVSAVAFAVVSSVLLHIAMEVAEKEAMARLSAEAAKRILNGDS